MTAKQKSAPRTKKNIITNDSFQNFMTRTGIGAGNIASASSYGFDLVSRNRVLMEAAYRSSWVVGQAVDVVAQDMTREGVEISGDELKPEQIEKMEKAATALKIWPSLTSTIKWARLYGGAVAVLLIDGQKLDTLLRLETIGKDAFKGLLVLDRWQMQPNFKTFVTDLGPDLGKPKFYNTVTDSIGMPQLRIHYSRVIRLEGVELPYYQRIAENGWGQSVIERLWDRLLAFDSTTQGAAQLVYKAHLRTMKVDGLRELIASGGKLFEGLVKQIEMIRAFQSSEGLTLLDGKDEFDTHTYTFSGLDGVLLQFGQQLAGALQIPLVRLFGQEPGGLSTDGQSALNTYYDNVKREQEAELRTGADLVYNVLHRSVFGVQPPESFNLTFKPLKQLTNEEKADINAKTVAAINDSYNAGIIDRATALRELRRSSQITGYWSNVTDDMITEAENEPPPGADELTEGDPTTGQDKPGNEPKANQPG